MSARWYKRCGADFIHGTMMLTLEEKGAYSLCLDLIYDRGGPIPDDARWISGVCGVSIRKWNSIRDRLIETGKITVLNGELSNARADFELVSMEKYSRNQAESGAKGGRKRAENDANSRKNKDLGQASLKPIDKSREDKKEDDDEGGAKKVALGDLVDRVARAAGINADPSRAIYSRFIETVTSWIEIGATPDEMIEVAQRKCAEHHEPIQSLKFLDPEIRQAVARRDNQTHAKQQPASNRAQQRYRDPSKDIDGAARALGFNA